MIPTGSVTALMGLDAIAVSSALHDQDIAMALCLVADSPTFDFWPPRGRADDVNCDRKRTFPSAFPILGRHGRASSNRKSYECE
jgi:hypothetical protein